MNKMRSPQPGKPEYHSLSSYVPIPHLVLPALGSPTITAFTWGRSMMHFSKKYSSKHLITDPIFWETTAAGGWQNGLESNPTLNADSHLRRLARRCGTIPSSSDALDIYGRRLANAITEVMVSVQSRLALEANNASWKWDVYR